MAIFGNKKKSVIERLDELLNEIDSLPEDEQEKVWAHFDDAKEEMEDDSAEDKGKPDTEEEIAKAKEDIAEKGEDSQTEKDRIDESVAAQEKANGDEDSQDAKDRIDESVGEQEKEDGNEDSQSAKDRVFERINMFKSERLVAVSAYAYIIYGIDLIAMK